MAGAFAFYMNTLVLLPRLFLKKKYWGYITAFILLFFLAVGLRALMDEVILPLTIGMHNYFEGVTVAYYIIDNIYFIGIFLLMSSIFWFVENQLRVQKEQEKMRMEIINAQQKMLGHQISPHFLFNMLNNIYAMVYARSNSALPAIQKLSNLMRYTLDKIESGHVTLATEIEMLNEYIELQQLRLNDKNTVIFTRSGVSPHITIAPLLLIPFVENAFKHGETNDINRPLTITLNAEETEIRFSVSNFILAGSKDSNSGIGINNVKQRLALIYPQMHQLRIEQTTDYYFMELLIQLNQQEK
ncbi:MAG: sensor histidine kinase [Bacteroidia bacterium]